MSLLYLLYLITKSHKKYLQQIVTNCACACNITSKVPFNVLSTLYAQYDPKEKFLVFYGENGKTFIFDPLHDDRTALKILSTLKMNIALFEEYNNTPTPEKYGKEVVKK